MKTLETTMAANRGELMKNYRAALQRGDEEAIAELAAALGLSAGEVTVHQTVLATAAELTEAIKDLAKLLAARQKGYDTLELTTRQFHDAANAAADKVAKANIAHRAAELAAEGARFSLEQLVALHRDFPTLVDEPRGLDRLRKAMSSQGLVAGGPNAMVPANVRNAQRAFKPPIPERV